MSSGSEENRRTCPDDQKSAQRVRRPVPTENDDADPDQKGPDQCCHTTRRTGFEDQKSQPECPERMSAEIGSGRFHRQDRFQVSIKGIVGDIRAGMGLKKADFQKMFAYHPAHEPASPEKSLTAGDCTAAKGKKHEKEAGRHSKFGVPRPADDTEKPWKKRRKRRAQSMSDGMVERPEHPVVHRQGKRSERQEKKNEPQPGPKCFGQTLFQSLSVIPEPVGNRAHPNVPEVDAGDFAAQGVGLFEDPGPEFDRRTLARGAVGRIGQHPANTTQQGTVFINLAQTVGPQKRTGTIFPFVHFARFE